MKTKIIFALFLFASFLFYGCVSLYYGQDDFLRFASTPETQSQYELYIEQNAPSENAYIAVQRLAEPFLLDKDWDRAIGVYQKYKPMFPLIQDRFDKTIEMLKKPEQKLIVKNLGKGINTIEDEYSPIPTADGKLLYFTGYSRAGGIGGEDIFVSESDNKEQWQNATQLGRVINTNTHEYSSSISTDGNQLIIFGNYSESFGKGDLFYSDKTSRGWATVKHYPEPINSSNFDCDGKQTSDGKALLFVTDRYGCVGDYVTKGTYSHGSYWGNTDIFVSIKTREGWSEPINLGEVINTPFAERSPYLHPDGKTLYFSSEGHYGMGRLDVFKSTRLKDDSWTEWSEPVNLGKEINGTGEDWGYIVTTQGDIAYFAAENKSGSIGKQDIYSITLPQEAKPEKVITVQGKVLDDKGNPLDANIVWEDIDTRQQVGTLRSDPQTGNYFIVLPMGKNYGYYAEKQGYYPSSRNINLKDGKIPDKVNEDIVLFSKEAMIEKEVRINNLFFEYDKYELSPKSYLELDRLEEILKDFPGNKVEISGHTDNLGGDNYNNKLSQQRAQSVVDYLVSKGLPANKFIAKGYGKSKPLAKNDTEEGRAMNRRVEFKIMK
ncbi:MAG: OmpA family protein [Bacteroidetes bacterium]|nr:OmpA family protein [Bacteroidota bacterium]